MSDKAVVLIEFDQTVRGSGDVYSDVLKGFENQDTSDMVLHLAVGSAADEVLDAYKRESTDNPRVWAWQTASGIVDELVEQHGLEDYSINTGPVTTARYTLVDQHLEAIVRVADWLLEGDNV